jgi:hypothetical protein
MDENPLDPSQNSQPESQQIPQASVASQIQPDYSQSSVPGQQSSQMFSANTPTPKKSRIVKTLTISLSIAALIAILWFIVLPKLILKHDEETIGTDISSSTKSIQDISKTKLANQATQISTNPVTSIRFPEGWSISTSDRAATAFGPIYNNGTLQPAIDVSVGDSPVGTLDYEVQSYKSTKQLEKEQLISEKSSTLAGSPAVTLEYKNAEITPKGQAQSYSLNLVVLSVINNKVFTIDATADENQYNTISLLFGQVIQSLTHQ